MDKNAMNKNTKSKTDHEYASNDPSPFLKNTEVLSNQRGMTLIEIMIVIAIIGGLAAMLLPRLVGSQEKAKAKQAKIQVAQIISSLELYYSDCGVYPSQDSGLNALVEAPPEDECDNWGPSPYMKKEPKDPWKRDFVYEIDDGEPVVISLGKDGQDGGSAYDKDISSEDF